MVDFCGEEKIDYITWSSSDGEVNDEADLSTLEHTEAQEARFQEEDVHQGGEADHQEKESERSNSSCRDSGRQAVVRLMVKVHGFGKEERIRKPSEFKKVLSSGRKIVTPHFAFYIHRKDTLGRRLGVSISRKVGDAVVRNRMKRLVREAFRLHKHDIPEDVDMVVIVRNAEGIRSLHDVREEFQRALGPIAGGGDT